ncbi:MAG: GDSL-type esterase/lipase family protein [Clostridia bacterium]
MPLKLKQKDVIVFEGDSLTRRDMSVNRDDWAYLRMMNWHESWTNTFEELLFSWHPELDLKFINAAVGGSNSKDLLRRLDTHVMQFNPSWIIVTVGTNDSHYIPLDEFAIAIKEYVIRVGVQGNSKVLFLGGFQVAEKFFGETTEFDAKQPYYDALKTIAAESGHYYLDIGKAIVKKSKLLFQQSDAHTVYGDGLHFNKLGNTIIAGEVLKAFGIVR